MKKYLGSKITAFAAIVVPMFILGPLIFGVSILCAEISASTVFLAIMCLGCTIYWIIYAERICVQLYSWGDFQRESVQVIVGHKKNTIIYSNCKGCGIGFYTHGVLNSNVGKRIYFIFLSYDVFDEKFRSNINLWKPSDTRIKVEYSKELYDYLVSVLPEKKAMRLSSDYKKYIL